ncbi:MAG TPA: hypothetical protein VGZ48_14160 [Candidatus Acidoferrales bacterium]|jgi:hypothetical protein|nr:hypothetical protein [Candidatus Acidoferrales bacterium]
MDENKYLTQVATIEGLKHYPRQGPWRRKSGAVMGLRDGLLTIIGFSRGRNEAKIVIIFRFKKFAQPEMLKTAITQNAALAGKKRGKLAAVGEDFLRWEWKYSFTKPKAEDVAAVADALRETIKPMVPAFDGKCEKCQFNSAPDLTLLNGLAMYICPGCQESVRMEQDQAAMNYAAKQPNYPNGIALGLGAALAGGLAWGLIAYGIHYIFLYGAIGIGYLVAQGIVKGTGKVTLFGQILIPVLTVASILFGDVIFFTLSYMKASGVAFSMKLVGEIVRNLWQVESDAGNTLSVVFGLIGAGVSLFYARKPKFKAVFEPLGAPGK